MADENTQTNAPSGDDQRSVIGSLLADIVEVATPVAVLAQPLVSKLVNQPPREKPQEVVLPPGVSGD